jgi:vacuolar-type H+-ATPase subunit D/Vma8
MSARNLTTLEFYWMPTQAERLAIVETKVANIEEKVDTLKADVKDLHDCLDRTRDLLDKKLDDMLVEYRANRDRYYQVLEDNKNEAEVAHASLANKISNLEKIKMRVTFGAVALVAFIAGTGYLTLEQMAKILIKLG